MAPSPSPSPRRAVRAKYPRRKQRAKGSYVSKKRSAGASGRLALIGVRPLPAQSDVAPSRGGQAAGPRRRKAPQALASVAYSATGIDPRQVGPFGLAIISFAPA